MYYIYIIVSTYKLNFYNGLFITAIKLLTNKLYNYRKILDNNISVNKRYSNHKQI